jgi:hypothetical protein
LKNFPGRLFGQHVGVEPVGPRGCAPPLGLTAGIQRFGGYATDEVALAPEPFDALYRAKTPVVAVSWDFENRVRLLGGIR